MSEGNHWSDIKDRDIIGEIMEAKKRIEEMPTWMLTDKGAKTEIVEIDGKRYIKYPQLSRKKQDGSIEVHPAFIENGAEKAFLLFEDDGLYYGLPIGWWPWYLQQGLKMYDGEKVVLSAMSGEIPVGDGVYSDVNITNRNRGPCGIPKNLFGANPYGSIATQNFCRSNPVNCRDCPMNPKREIQRENKPKSGNQTGGKYGYR